MDAQGMKQQLQARGITQARVVREVLRLFPDRTCSKQMVNMVLNGHATSSYVEVAVLHLLRKRG